jgi:2-iminobutanoate/2-iminopropanoate deaminase
MQKTIIKPAGGAPAIGPYSTAVRVGELLFCSGQIALIPETGNVVTAGIREQTQRVMENIKIILQDQKLDFSSVVKASVFLTDFADFAVMNEVYGSYFKGDFPARTTVQVAALPRGVKVEIETIAHY